MSYSARRLFPDDIISESPARKPSGLEAKLDFNIAQYMFVDPDEYIDQGYRTNIMVCGPLTFLNHDDVLNCSISWRKSLKPLIFMRLIALTNISSGSELTIRYTDARDYKQCGYLELFH
ncbi:SET domain-containing protein-lysine N-methyltransferase [Breoghania sp.]|uniref:SET domain-containing protein-lysine N-methyltransferase n=1 Tax=Breoghania sp. TaxID=2065378 RepID=UPI00374A612B